MLPKRAQFLVSKIGGGISRLRPIFRHRRKVQGELAEQTALLETHKASAQMMAAEGWCGRFNAEIKTITEANVDQQQKGLNMLRT